MGEPFDRAYTLDGIFRTGWEALKREPVGLLVGSLILGMATQSNQMSFPGDIDPEQVPKLDAALLATFGAFAVIAIVVAIAGLLVRAWIEPGYLRHQRNLVMYGKSDVGTVFTATDAFGAMLGWFVLSGLVSFGLGALMCLPGGGLLFYGISREAGVVALGGAVLLLVGLLGAIYVALGLHFGTRLVALDGLGPMEALGRSWELARGNRLYLATVEGLVGLAVLVLGCSTCLVGFIPLGAITSSGFTAAFLRFTRDEARGYALLSGEAPVPLG